MPRESDWCKVCLVAAVPGQHRQGPQVDPVDSIQNQQLPLNGCSDQRRRPPRGVSVREGVPLLEKVPGGHVLQDEDKAVRVKGQFYFIRLL